MSARMFIAWLVSAACICLQGCYLGRKVAVRVVDAESQQPISGAAVEVDYGAMGISYTPLVLLAPHPPDRVVTDDEGLAALRVHNVGPSWDVRAEGYLPYTGFARKGRVPDDFIKARSVEGDEISILPLYRAPAPLVWIVVPDGYRGAIRATRIATEHVAADAAQGRREFVFHATADGYVTIEMPALLRASPIGPEPSVRFRYAAGAEIPREHLRARAALAGRFPPATQPYFGWDLLYSAGPQDLYVVGDVRTTMELIEPFRHERGGYVFGPEGMDKLWAPP